MRMQGANGNERVCNILRQKCDFKVNDVSSGVGRLLGETWMGLLQSHKGTFCGCLRSEGQRHGQV